MAKIQFFFFICIIILLTLFSTVCQETALHKNNQSIDQCEIFKNDTFGHDLHKSNNIQKDFVDVNNSEAKSGLSNHVIGLNEKKMENKSIICKKETFDQDNNTNSRDIKDFKRTEPGQEYNETLKCFKIRNPICHSPFHSPSSLLIDLNERHRLIDNITLKVNFQDSKQLHLMFIAVILMIITSKQLNFIAQLSYFKMLPTFDNSLLIKNNLENCVDIKTILKSSDIKMKDTNYYKDPIGTPDKSIFHLPHQTAFQNFSQFFVYPVFNMTRLASYRPISLAESPISFSELSEAGFYFSSQENAIVCECCKKIISLMSVETSPSHAIYHNHGCQYIRDEMPAGNMPNRISTSLGASHFVTSSNQHENMSQNLSIPGFSELNMTSDISALLLEGLQDFGLSPHTINGPTLVKNQNYRKEDCSCEENNKYLKLQGLELEIPNLESQFQNEFFQLLTRCARLTAKIERKDTEIFGSGYVIHFPCRKILSNSIQQMPEWNEDLKKMFQDNPEVGIVFIQTTSHLFPEAGSAIKDTEVSLSLDDSRYNNLKLNGHFVFFSTKKGISQAILVCFTADMDVIKRINELQKDFLSAAGNVTDECKEFMSMSVFIISHPHGKEKKLSFGQSSVGKYIILNNEGREILSEYNQSTVPSSSGILRKALLYDALTCDGSSGAPVVAFTKASGSAECILDIWTHNGINIPDTKGVAVMREYIHEENTSAESSEINSTLNSSGGQQSIPPMFEASTVLIGDTQLRNTYQVPPSYPIFSTTLKRVESFQGWKFTHIMSPNVLAEAGFFSAGYADCVRCFQCGLGLRSWKLGDDVYTEHERFRPTCPLLQSQLTKRYTPSAQTASGNTNQVQTHLGMSTLSNSAPSQDSPKLQMLLNLAVSDNLVADSSKQTSVLDGVMSSELPPHSTDSRNESNSASLTDELENASIEIQPTMESIPSQASSQLTKTLFQTANDTNGGAKNVEAKLLERENKMLHDLLKCKLCKEAPVKDLFLPCGDLYACCECSQKLTHCPACGKRILGTVTTHF